MKLGNRLLWMSLNLRARAYKPPEFERFVLHLPLRTSDRTATVSTADDQGAPVRVAGLGLSAGEINAARIVGLAATVYRIRVREGCWPRDSHDARITSLRGWLRCVLQPS